MAGAWSRKNLWASTPAWGKAAAGMILGHVPLPWLLGRSFRSWMRFLRAAQWWDAEQYEAFQLAHLREIVTLAYDKTDFYRRLFGSVGFEPGDLKSTTDFFGLPTIDKNTVRENLPRMLTRSVGARDVDYMSTSGTGGTPLAFYINRDRSSVEFAHLAMSWERVGYRTGMPLAVLRGNIVERVRNGMHYEYDPLLRQHIYSSFHLTQESMTKYLQHMHQVRPSYLHAYPSSAYALVRFMVERDLTFPSSLTGILLESEPVVADQRAFIAAHFSGCVYSCYGHTEKLVLGAECAKSTLYHAWPTYGYCEVLDELGKPTRNGVSGEIVGTGFINRVVPFIRYRTDDYATLVGRGCGKCGRQHQLLDRMQSHRSQEYLLTKNNKPIVAWAISNMHDRTFEGVAQFQFVQRVPGEAELWLVPSVETSEPDLDAIRTLLTAKVGREIEFTLHVCNQLEANRSGKRPLVKQMSRVAANRVSLVEQ